MGCLLYQFNIFIITDSTYFQTPLSFTKEPSEITIADNPNETDKFGWRQRSIALTKCHSAPTSARELDVIERQLPTTPMNTKHEHIEIPIENMELTLAWQQLPVNIGQTNECHTETCCDTIDESEPDLDDFQDCVTLAPTPTTIETETLHISQRDKISNVDTFDVEYKLGVRDKGDVLDNDTNMLGDDQCGDVTPRQCAEDDPGCGIVQHGANEQQSHDIDIRWRIFEDNIRQSMDGVQAEVRQSTHERNEIRSYVREAVEQSHIIATEHQKWLDAGRQTDNDQRIRLDRLDDEVRSVRVVMDALSHNMTHMQMQFDKLCLSQRPLSDGDVAAPPTATIQSPCNDEGDGDGASATQTEATTIRTNPCLRHLRVLNCHYDFHALQEIDDRIQTAGRRHNSIRATLIYDILSSVRKQSTHLFDIESIGSTAECSAELHNRFYDIMEMLTTIMYYIIDTCVDVDAPSESTVNWAHVCKQFKDTLETTTDIENTLRTFVEAFGKS